MSSIQAIGLYYEISQKFAFELARYLSHQLPNISKSWWQKCVMSNLSPMARKNAASRGSLTLEELDLAALLKIFEKNLYDIHPRGFPPKKLFAYIKELQIIRNEELAHPQAKGTKIDEIFRALDTTERVAKYIAPDSGLIKEIVQLKNNLLGGGMVEKSSLYPRKISNSQKKEVKPGSRKRIVFDAGCDGKGGSISDVAAKMGCTTSNITQHLSQIKAMGYDVFREGDKFWITD